MTIKSFINKKLDKTSLILIIISCLMMFYLQYIENILPCKLCIIQRYFYYIVSILLMIRISKKDYSFQLGIIFTLGLLIILSGYQSLLEWGMVKDILGCGINPQKTKDLASIMGASPTVDCHYANFKFLGLSLSNFSLMFSLILFILYFTQYYNLELNKK